MAYHFFATKSSGSWTPDIRAFSVNFPAATPTFVKTLVNAAGGPAEDHFGILVNATYTGPFVTSLKFTGLGTFPSGRRTI
jgi:hypothetical protein